MQNECEICPYHDIKVINDDEVDDRVNFIIRCEGQEQLIIVQNFFKTKGKTITGDKAMEVLCI